MLTHVLSVHRLACFLQWGYHLAIINLHNIFVSIGKLRNQFKCRYIQPKTSTEAVLHAVYDIPNDSLIVCV